MNKYAMINRETNIVENKIVWDGISKYECHHGCYLVQLEESDFVDIGYLYDALCTSPRWSFYAILSQH